MFNAVTLTEAFGRPDTRLVLVEVDEDLLVGVASVREDTASVALVLAPEGSADPTLDVATLSDALTRVDPNKLVVADLDGEALVATDVRRELGVVVVETPESGTE